MKTEQTWRLLQQKTHILFLKSYRLERVETLKKLQENLCQENKQRLLSDRTKK